MVACVVVLWCVWLILCFVVFEMVCCLSGYAGVVDCCLVAVWCFNVGISVLLLCCMPSVWFLDAACVRCCFIAWLVAGLRWFWFGLWSCWVVVCGV